MSIIDALGEALLKVTDAMSESRRLPVNLLGPVLYEVGDWTLDKLDTIDGVMPVQIRTRKATMRQVQNAFDLGREMGRSEDPLPPMPRVRHLHTV